MKDTKPCNAPLGTFSKLVLDEPGPSVNKTMYRGITGSLLYLSASRPNIRFSVGIGARF